MEFISSRANPKVKHVRALRQRKARQEAGLILVEGIRPVGEAIEAGAALEALYYAPDLLTSDYARSLAAEQDARGLACYAVTPEVFESLAEKDNPQGLLAVVRRPQVSLDTLTPANFPWGAALVSPQDPGNVGTILRTIDAVGASGLLLLDSTLDAYHPSAVRASMGTLFWRPPVEAKFAEFLAWARRHAYTLVGTSAHASQDYRTVARYPRPLILLLGSERAGLTPEQSAACDLLLSLPMLGRATSLNLAVAAGVLLYQILAKSG